MNAEQRQRAGRAVEQRIREMGSTIPRVARTARVNESTVRALIHGDRWPSLHTRDALCVALEWPPGEVARRAIEDPERDLKDYSTATLLAEIERRTREAGI